MHGGRSGVVLERFVGHDIPNAIRSLILGNAIIALPRQRSSKTHRCHVRAREANSLALPSCFFWAATHGISVGVDVHFPTNSNPTSFCSNFFPFTISSVVITAPGSIYTTFSLLPLLLSSPAADSISSVLYWDQSN